MSDFFKPNAELVSTPASSATQESSYPFYVDTIAVFDVSAPETVEAVYKYHFSRMVENSIGYNALLQGIVMPSWVTFDELQGYSSDLEDCVNGTLKFQYDPRVTPNVTRQDIDAFLLHAAQVWASRESNPLYNGSISFAQNLL